MITAKDFCDIVTNKIASDMWKSLIRNSLPSILSEGTSARHCLSKLANALA